MAEKRSDEVLEEPLITPISKKIKNDAITTISISETDELMGSTTSLSTVSESDSIFDLELFHLECYEIIWFNSDVENPIQLNRLRKISDYVKFFDHIDHCRQYIEMIMAASDKSVLFLVTSDLLADKLISSVHHLKQISSIHSLIKISEEQEWMTSYAKVKTHTALQPLLKSLLQDIYHYSKTHENQNGFHTTGNNGMEENTTDNIESWWPKLVYIIVQLPYPEDCFQRFLAAMRMYYRTNPSELQHINQLEINYLSTASKNPIKEYTKDTFLYRFINRILRQKNIHFMFLFGFFLRDLYQQLQCEHQKTLGERLKDSRITVYRGQIMSKAEIDKLKTSAGNTVTSTFLSTTFDPETSEMYLGTSMPDDDLQSVLFEIELNTAEKSFPYADISKTSCFPSESEILLMPGLEFKLTKDSLYYDAERKIWLAKLELVSDTIEKVDCRLLEGFGERRKMRYYIELLTETLTEFCSATMPLIQTVFNQLVEIFSAEKWIVAVQTSCLARYILDHDLNHTRALEKWNEALKYWLEFKDDDELNVNISIGQIYYEIAFINYLHVEDTRKATENFDLSINHFQNAIERGLTNFEQINIYELLHEMYGKKFITSVVGKDNKDDVKENQLMTIKYQELHLASMLKFYAISDERINIAVKQLIDYYDECNMFDEELHLSKRLLELYERDGTVKNSEKIVEQIEKIISIYFLHKNDPETANTYISLLEEYTKKEEEEEDTEADDDFMVDYRGNGEETVHTTDMSLPRRRWSTVD